MAAALHERLVFDVARGAVRDADRRYVLLRADVLMGVFAQLEGEARDAALAAFARSVAEHGAASVRAYRDAVGTDELPQAMERAAASLGWGRWRIDAARVHEASPSLALEVENSPFAAAAPRGSARACHGIAGMLEALAAALWSGAADARETRCAAQGGATCSFVAVPRAQRAAASLSEPGPAHRPSRPGDTP
ncbi:MAG TPA: 4-vinyl reductase [Caldimonas sp.]|jgi:predicted hydrocarbon binding protein|nr:4-vinyl reductase [Caldimonas sp.]